MPRCARICTARGSVREPVDARPPVERSARLDLVVATAPVRAQFRDRLHVYAPAIIAASAQGTLGSKSGWLSGRRHRYREVRAVHAPGKRRRPVADQQQYHALGHGQAQLRSGEIDPRLPVIIAVMVHSHPLRIVDFAGQSPGGGPASLLRPVDLATRHGGASHARGIHRLDRGSIKAQRAEYHRCVPVTLRGGQTVLRIGTAREPLSQRRTAVARPGPRGGAKRSVARATLQAATWPMVRSRWKTGTDGPQHRPLPVRGMAEWNSNWYAVDKSREPTKSMSKSQNSLFRCVAGCSCVLSISA